MAAQAGIGEMVNPKTGGCDPRRSAGEQAVGQGLMDEASWAAAIRDLYRAAENDGTFCYTFFKAIAQR